MGCGASSAVRVPHGHVLPLAAQTRPAALHPRPRPSTVTISTQTEATLSHQIVEHPVDSGPETQDLSPPLPSRGGDVSQDEGGGKKPSGLEQKPACEASGSGGSVVIDNEPTPGGACQTEGEALEGGENTIKEELVAERGMLLVTVPKIVADEGTQKADEIAQKTHKTTQKTDETTQKTDETTQKTAETTQKTAETTQKTDKVTQKTDKVAQETGEAQKTDDTEGCPIAGENAESQTLVEVLKSSATEVGISGTKSEPKLAMGGSKEEGSVFKSQSVAVITDPVAKGGRPQTESVVARKTESFKSTSSTSLTKEKRDASSNKSRSRENLRSTSQTRLNSSSATGTKNHDCGKIGSSTKLSRSRESLKVASQLYASKSRESLKKLDSGSRRSSKSRESLANSEERKKAEKSPVKAKGEDESVKHKEKSLEESKCEATKTNLVPSHSSEETEEAAPLGGEELATEKPSQEAVTETGAKVTEDDAAEKKKELQVESGGELKEPEEPKHDEHGPVVEAKAGEEGTETKVGEGGTEAKAGEEGTEAKAGEEGTEAKVGEEGTEAKVGEGGTEAKAGEEGTEAKVGEEGTEAKVGEEGTEAKVGEEGTEAKAGEEGTEAKAGEEGTEAKVGEEGTEMKTERKAEGEDRDTNPADVTPPTQESEEITKLDSVGRKEKDQGESQPGETHKTQSQGDISGSKSSLRGSRVKLTSTKPSRSGSKSSLSSKHGTIMDTSMGEGAGGNEKIDKHTGQSESSIVEAVEKSTVESEPPDTVAPTSREVALS